MRRSLANGVSVPALAVVCALGIYEEACAQAGSSEKSVVALEEIVVTARRRAETLQNAPVSVSVIDGARLEAGGQARVKDLATLVPNFTISDPGSVNSNTTIVIRGISTNARNVGFEAGVGVYIDGVFTGRPSSFNQDLVDVERVEVLRGPQGTLYGKNTIAGAVNIYTVKPSYELGGQASLELGNYDLRTGRASLNAPLVDGRLAARLSVYGKKRDGYVTNLLDGAKYNNDDAAGARLQVRWDPAEYAAVNLSFDYLEEDRRHAFAEVLGDPAAPGVRTTINDAPPFEERILWGGAATAEFSLPTGETLTFITAYRTARIHVGNDNDNTAADLLSVDFSDTQEQVSQEVRLVSNGNGALSYVAGLYLYAQEARSFHRGVFGRDFPLTMGGLAFIDGVAKVDTTSFAAYADLQYDLTDRLALLGGLRLTREEKDLAYRQDGGLLPGVIFEPIPTITDTLGDTDLSASAGLRFKVSDDINVYGRYARGYKSGGWNADFIGSALVAAGRNNDGAFDGEGIDFAPESVDSFEFGLKSRWFDRRLNANLTAFRMSYKDLQVSQFLGVLSGGTVITNAGKAEIKGLEFELAAQPTPDLRLDFSLGYLDAEFESYADCAPGVPSCAGRRLPDAPKWSAAAGAEYVYRGLGFADLTTRVDVSHRDDVFATPVNEPRLSINSYTLVNAAITLSPPEGRWSVTLWGRNLTDKDFLVGVINDDLLATGRAFGGYGAPRTYGLRLGLKY